MTWISVLRPGAVIPSSFVTRIRGFFIFKYIKICRQAKGYWQDTYDKRTSPLGKEYYWLTGSFINQDNSEETDEWALEKGYVSVVPISYDMTSHGDLDELKRWKFN
jgi:5'-nucleotidase